MVKNALYSTKHSQWKNNYSSSWEMSDRAITKRMNALCRCIIGVQGASAHDGRHYCATALAIGGTDVRSLRDIGGWKSAATALRYINSMSIANKGAKYGEVK